MVDSSVGGKTGFNHPRGKNLVGAFHQPQLVWAALDTLTTLSARDRRAGLGEVVKTALLDDAEALAVLERDADALASGDPEATARAVAACVRCKASVVAEDEREAGRRAILNLGHTVGHGLEAALGYGTLLHGEAVALGLVEELAWTSSEGLTADSTLTGRIADLLGRMGLPTVLPEVDPNAVWGAMALDKKASGDTLALPVVVSAGNVRMMRLPRRRLPELFPAR